MAEALTSVVRVTFLASMGSSKQRGDLIRRDRDVEWTEAPASGIDRTRRYLLSTIEPQTVLSAFDDPDHPWWMQAQIFCLSDRNTDPPALDHATARGLCGDGWVEDGQMLIHLGLKGIMRPGVDGDVAGLWTSEQSYNSAILGSLESHVRRAGHQWIELDEDNFMQRLASYG